MVWVFTICVFIVFSPFIFLAFYNHPSIDDFCLAVSFRDSMTRTIFSIVVDWYQGIGGRYFSYTLLGVFTRYLDLIEHYKFIPLLLFSAWIISFYVLLESTFIGAPPATRLAGALTFFVFYLLTMPVTSEGFYWMTSAFVYQSGNILAIITLTCMIRLRTTKYPCSLALVTALLLFAVIGSSGLHMVFMVVLVIALSIYVFSTGQRYRHIWGLFLLVTLLSAALMSLAPGNEARGQHFIARHQFLFSMAESAYHTVMWSFQWVWEPLLWLVTLLYLFWLPGLLEKSQLCQKVRLSHLTFVLACWMGILFACFFIGFWSMGDILPERALNVVYLIFLIGWFSFITILVSNILHYPVISLSALETSPIGRLTVFAVAITLIIGMLSSDKFHTAYVDYFDLAPQYDDKIQARYLAIAKASATSHNLIAKVPEVDVFERPSTISSFFMDMGDDWRNFPNPCYAEYFRVAGIETTKQ